MLFLSVASVCVEAEPGWGCRSLGMTPHVAARMSLALLRQVGLVPQQGELISVSGVCWDCYLPAEGITGLSCGLSLWFGLSSTAKKGKNLQNSVSRTDLYSLINFHKLSLQKQICLVFL